MNHRHPPRRFSHEPLDSLRHRLPDYLTAHGVELRRNGTRLLGRCPNHDDSRPSFAVFGARHESCGCYPCGFSGDIFAVSKWLGRSSNFPEAVAEVAATLGVHLPHAGMGNAPHPLPPPQAFVRKPEPPFTLTEAGTKRVHLARLAFCDAFFSGDPIVDRIAASLGVARETLRLAAYGSCGLGLAEGWLCYAYPQGLKWRNPDTKAKCRFRWLLGKATTPWRMGFRAGGPVVDTVYLTEGESDCLTLMDAGLEADGTAACVASPGTSFLREWAPLFHGKRVVLCFDTDPPGQRASAAVASLLRGHAREILTVKRTILHE